MEQSSDICSDFQLKKCLYGRRLHLDRISSLPDDVLLFILSFLSFKEVVKTSLLSRRWLNLWVHTLVLDFHAPVTLRYLINDTERQNYVEWVNCVLQQHKCQYLKEFKIVCHLDKPNEKDIDSWLVFAFARKVECLELNLLRRGRYPTNIRSNYVFPDRFLGFNSGEANSDGGRSRILQFDFKCLKSLSLMKVDVTGEAINFFLLNCPFLERLEVVGTRKLVNLVILDPTLVLKSLKIKLCCMLTVLRVSNFNLVSLEIPSVNDLTIINLPMLVELSIRGTSEKLSRSFSQASSCFSRLEALTFIGYYLKDVTLLSNTDQLTKLKRLVINVRASSNESLTMFMSIISSCPQLEEFVLMLNWLGREQTGNNINKVERRGSSLKSKSLKVFEFFGYYGSDRNFELMMHVMENGVGLEKIIIDLTPRYACWTNRAKEARRSIALQQLDSVRESLPPHVHLLIRN